MLFATMTWRQRADSCLKKAAVSSGELPTGLAACSRSLAATSGSFSVSPIAAESLAAIAAGGFGGAAAADPPPPQEPGAASATQGDGAQLRDPGVARDCQDFQLSALDVRQNVCEVVEHEVHPAGEEVDCRGRYTLVGHVRDANPGCALQQFAGHVSRATRAGRGIS